MRVIGSAGSSPPSSAPPVPWPIAIFVPPLSSGGLMPTWCALREPLPPLASIPSEQSPTAFFCAISHWLVEIAYGASLQGGKLVKSAQS
jgi:hypothetical protein